MDNELSDEDSATGSESKLKELKISVEKFYEVFEFNEKVKIQKKISFGTIVEGVHK